MSDDRVRALREEFDQTFSRAIQSSLEQLEDVLMIRVGGDPYAIRLREIGGIVAKRPIVNVPAMAPHLLGLAGVRGDVVPVYRLASILGHGDDADAPGWMVLCGDAPRVALAFAHFDGYQRLPSSSLHADATAQANRPFVSEVVTTGSHVSAVISVARVVDALRSQSQKAKER